MSMTSVDLALQKLSKSKFRSSFHLNKKMKDYVISNGYDKIRIHAEEILRKRVQAAYPKNDGKQTPMKQVHPVFIAQHATACCCRGCIEKWHGMPKGIELNEEQINYLTTIIMKWIETKIKIPQQIEF